MVTYNKFVTKKKLQKTLSSDMQKVFSFIYIVIMKNVYVTRTIKQGFMIWGLAERWED